MPGITISAGYGAGGSVLAPQLAERLGWRFLDRAISSAVAEQLDLPVAEAEAGGPGHTWWTQVLVGLAAMSPELTPAGLALAASGDEESQIREVAESLLRREVRGGGAVVLGRAGSCALLEEPDVLRVRLYGSREDRVAQARRIEGVDEETARRRIEQVDSSRDQYMERLYGRNPAEQSLYHLQLDSTALPLDSCLELIVAAFERLPKASVGA